MQGYLSLDFNQQYSHLIYLRQSVGTHYLVKHLMFTNIIIQPELNFQRNI